jgi:hypothetical protein
MIKKISLLIGLVVVVAAVAFAVYQVVQGDFLFARAQTCNPEVDLRGSINGTTASITNTSSSCNYSVGYAVYRVYSGDQTTQSLYDNESRRIGPSSSVTLNASLPTCAYQADLFYGDLIQVFASNVYYGDRKIDAKVAMNSGYCHQQPQPQTAKITLIKTVINNDGGTNTASDFNLYVGSTMIRSGQSVTVPAGTYQVREDVVHNYTPGAWGGDCNAQGQVTVSAGQHKTCTITNDDKPTPPPPPQKGCIAIVKETFDTNGNRIYTAPQFTFKLDNNQTAQNNASGNAYFYEVSVGSHTVSEVIPDGWHNFNITPSNGVVNVTAGSQCVGVVFKNKQNAPATPNLDGYCIANPRYVNINDTVTWTAHPTGGTGNYEYTWSGWDNLSGTGNSVTKSYSYAGDKPSTVTIRSGNQTITRNCTVTVNQPQVQNLDGYCYANPRYAQVGQNVQWIANASGGTGNYTYEWSGWDNLSGSGSSITRTYSYAGDKPSTVTIRSGNQTITRQCTATIQEQQNQYLSVSCYADASSVQTGTSVRYNATVSGGTGNYSYSWTGSDGVSGSNNYVTQTYHSTGNKHAQVTVYSGNQSSTANCYVNVYENNYNNLSGSCWVNSSNPNINDYVTWSANASGGNGNYSYSWTGTDGLSGSGSSLSKQYAYAGQKYGTVTIYSGNQSVQKTCYLDVRSQPYVPPPTYIPPPPNKGGGVYLSQLPYTGAGDNFKVIGFIAGLLVWSIGIAYFLVQRKAKKQGLTVTELLGGVRNFVFAQHAPAVASPVIDDKLEALKEKFQIKPAVASVMAMTRPMVRPPEQLTPAAETSETQVRISDKGEVIESLEARARELETLVSADGLNVIVQVANNNKHTASIILNHLVELYKESHEHRDNEWTVLNAEKINQILFSTYITMTPVFVGWLAEGNEKKTLAFIRMLQMQGQSVKDFVTNVIIELDKVYRSRIDSSLDVDTDIAVRAEGWSDQELEQAIHILVGAVDQTYKSTYSSIKIALIKILDMAKVRMTV